MRKNLRTPNQKDLLNFQYQDYEPQHHHPKPQKQKFKSKNLYDFRKTSYQSNKFRFLIDETQPILNKSELNWCAVLQTSIVQSNEITCSICLSETQWMVAPQITECGHIFCLICFLQHAEKSINRHNCPVCNEIIQKENLKSVKIQIFAPVQEKNEITLKLVARNKLNDVFVEIDTGQVDMTYQKFRAASYDTMTKIYNEEVQIIHFQEDHPNEDIPKDYLQKALEFLENRFSRQLKVKQQEQEKESNHLEDLTNNPKNYHFIYQEVHGLPVFLNPISYRFLLDQHLISSQLPKIIKQQVFKLETINLKDRYKDNYKLLSHIQEWEEIQFADIKMRDLLDEAKFEKFKKEIKKYKIKNDKSSPRIRKKSNQVQEKVQAYQQQEEYKFQEIKEDNLEYFPTLDNQPKISQKEEEPIQYIENQFNHSKFESWEQKFQAAPRIVQKQKEEEKQIEETYLKSDNQMDLQFTINIKQKKKKNKNK